MRKLLLNNRAEDNVMKLEITKKDINNFRPTIFEKMFIFSHLPFTLGALLVALFVGPLGNFLYYYAISANVVEAFYRTLFSVNMGGIGFTTALSSYWYSLVGNLLWYIFLFYVAFIIRYLRRRLIYAEPELISLAPNGNKDVRRIFRIVSMTVPQLVIMTIFLFVYATSVPDLLAKGELTVLSTPVYILRSLFRSIMFGSVLWLFGSSLWGLYNFGKLRLKLKSCYEDSMLGTRELGSLSFSFSIPYFIGLTLFAGQEMILGRLPGETSLINMISMLILIPAGITLFMAPLVSTHHRMLEAKKAEKTSAEKEMSGLMSRIRETGEKDDRNVIRLLLLETLERKVEKIKTWPIDNPLIGKLALIAISVTAALIAQGILTFFQI